MHKRPLSPHLQIYKPQWTSVLSIFHRFSGMALFGVLVFVSTWLLSGYQGKESYESFLEVCRHPFVKGVLFLLGVVFIYHFLNGLRHLVWDTGKGLSLHTAKNSALLVMILTVFLSFLWGRWVWGGG